MAAGTNSNTTQVGANGTSHSSTKYLGGFSSSSRLSSAQIRSVTLRKRPYWASESIEEGRRSEAFDDARLDTTATSSVASSSGDDRSVEQERTIMPTSCSRAISGVLEVLRLLRTLREGYRLSCLYRCQDALDVYQKLSSKQYNTRWVLSQGYYSASAKEFMRINGTTKSMVANHLGESIAGAMTIRAFQNEERFFIRNLKLIDKNASPFHIYSANEWFLQRLETLSVIVLCSSALLMVLLPQGTLSSGKNRTKLCQSCSFELTNGFYDCQSYDVAGFIGMALSYGLSLNMSLVFSTQNQCTLANSIISVERLSQYMKIPSEAPEVIEGNRHVPSWPAVGRVELHDLKIRYRADTPLVLQGITCTFEGGHNIGIVGRTGSVKTTLISALFRIVEPFGGKIVIDGIDISTIGLHDLRTRLGIIPQDPTLFKGTVRYNLDPLSQHSDQEIWEVLEKCQPETRCKRKKKGYLV